MFQVSWVNNPRKRKILMMTHTLYWSGRVNWRFAFGILCDKNVSLELKGKFRIVMVRPTSLYEDRVQANQEHACLKDEISRYEEDAQMRV